MDRIVDTNRIGIIDTGHGMLNIAALVEAARRTGSEIVIIDSMSAVPKETPSLHAIVDKMVKEMPKPTDDPRDNFRKFLKHKKHKRR